MMNFTIELTEQEIQLVLNGLAKLPLEQSFNTFFSVKNQYETATAMLGQPDDQASGGTD
jgi:hypothetical protein